MTFPLVTLSGCATDFFFHPPPCSRTAILDDEDLCHFLQVYGTILSCSLSRDENGISLGYGVATFATPAEANYAREMLDGQMQSGIRLSCKK